MKCRLKMRWNLKIAILVMLLMRVASGTVSLRLRGNVIPSNGAGSALITDIGPNNDDALICFSDQPNCCSGPGNWFVKYGSQQQRRVQSDDRVLGWMRNRSRNPTVVRLRSRSSDPQPGQSQEGVYTCEMMGDGVVSVGLYYSLNVTVKFKLNSFIVNPTYTVTCTVTGGTVLHSSFTGLGGENLGPVSAVGVPERHGRDTYQAVVTRETATANHGDTFNCTASNGASTAANNYTLSVATAPSNVTWEQVASSVLRVRWSQPAGGAPVRSYTIIAIYGNGVVAAYITMKRNHQFATIQRLVNDGRMYSISVIATSDYLPGITSFTVSLTQLSPPSFIITSVTGTTANLTLSPPTSLTSVTPDNYLITISLVMIEGKPGGCPNYGNNTTISMNSRKSFMILNDLHEASTYNVTIQAISQMMGDSSPSLPLSFTTSDTAPSEPPRDLQVSGVTSSSVGLVWDPLLHCVNVNGVPNGWQVRYWELENGLEEMSSFVTARGSPLVAGSANVTGLQPCTNYTFQVAAVTGNQFIGIYSNSIVARTQSPDDEGRDEGGETGEASGSNEDLIVYGSFCIQVQFGQTDHCITWTEGKARKVEKDLLTAINDYISQKCPGCNETLFLGQHGIFICRDNPHTPTYRLCHDEPITSSVVHLIEQWVSSEPYLQVGWLMATVNPHCPVVVSSHKAEHPVAIVSSHQTVTDPSIAMDLISMCITELHRVCNTTSQ